MGQCLSQASNSCHWCDSIQQPVEVFHVLHVVNFTRLSLTALLTSCVLQFVTLDDVNFDKLKIILKNYKDFIIVKITFVACNYSTMFQVNGNSYKTSISLLYFLLKLHTTFGDISSYKHYFENFLQLYEYIILRKFKLVNGSIDFWKQYYFEVAFGSSPSLNHLIPNGSSYHELYTTMLFRYKS